MENKSKKILAVIPNVTNNTNPEKSEFVFFLDNKQLTVLVILKT